MFVVFEIDRRRISVLPAPTRPEIVSSIEMVADRSIHCIKVEWEVDGCEFTFPVLPYFYFRFGRKWLSETRIAFLRLT